jgi:hypothetical protein
MCFASVCGAVSGVHCGIVSGKVYYVRRADTPSTTVHPRHRSIHQRKTHLFNQVLFIILIRQV